MGLLQKYKKFTLSKVKRFLNISVHKHTAEDITSFLFSVKKQKYLVSYFLHKLILK